MNEGYSDKLVALRYEIEVGEGRLSVIDGVVADLFVLSGDHLASDLLLMLSDAAKYDEGDVFPNPRRGKLRRSGLCRGGASCLS